MAQTKGLAFARGEAFRIGRSCAPRGTIWRAMRSLRMSADAAPSGCPRHLDQVVSRFQRFGQLKVRDIDRLGDLVRRAKDLPPHRTIFAEGRRCRTGYLLVDGWAAEVRLLPDGGRQVLQLRLPGEMFGLDCMAYGLSLHAVQTWTRCRVAPIEPHEFEALRHEYPVIADAVFRMALFERAIAHEWAISLGRRAAWSRVGHLLLELAERCAMSELFRDAVPFPLTQQDVADCTGLTPSYVNRVLVDMRSRGLVRIDARSLTIADWQALAGHVGFRPHYLRQLPPAQPNERQR